MHGKKCGQGLIIVLIDGQNFRYKIPEWKNMEIDYFQLGRILYGEDFSQDILERMRVIYFDMFLIDRSAPDFSDIEEKNRFIGNLSNRGVEVKTADYNALPTKKNGRRDTNMDRFIIQNLKAFASDPNVSHIVLLSGDGGFTQYLRYARNQGKSVTVLSVRDSLSPKIINSNFDVIFFEDARNILLAGQEEKATS